MDIEAPAERKSDLSEEAEQVPWDRERSWVENMANDSRETTWLREDAEKDLKQLQAASRTPEEKKRPPPEVCLLRLWRYPNLAWRCWRCMPDSTLAHC